MTTDYPKSDYAFEMDEDRTSIGSGDNWPITWGADDELFTFFTDGKGFELERDGLIGSAPARILGTPPDIRGRMIDSESGTVEGEFDKQNAKASGLVIANGVLYCFLRNINPPGQPQGTGSSLMYSEDNAITWTKVDWQWNDIGYPVWLNAGKDFTDAQDDYLYFVAPDGPSAYADYHDILLGRVHRDRATEQDAYAFFGGTAESGPIWGAYEGRQPVFSNPEGCFRPGFEYNAAIGRYMLLISCPHTEWEWWFNENPTRASYFAIYESENPWGPWAEVHKDRSWNKDEDRFQPRIPAKWITSDGLSFHLLYSCIPRGPYQFNLHQCRLTKRG